MLFNGFIGRVEDSLDQLEDRLTAMTETNIRIFTRLNELERVCATLQEQPAACPMELPESEDRRHLTSKPKSRCGYHWTDAEKAWAADKIQSLAKLLAKHNGRSAYANRLAMGRIIAEGEFNQC